MDNKIIMKGVGDLKPYGRNPRKNEQAVEAVAASIREFGDLFEYDNVACIGGKYIVTRDGTVFILTAKGARKQQPRKHTNGYVRCVMFGKDEYVHRVVAKCYIPNIGNHGEVNHKDGDKGNNHVDNLEWCTRSQNNKHAFDIGLRAKSSMSMLAKMPKNKSRKYTQEAVREIKTMIEIGKSDRQIADTVGGSRGAVYQIRVGKTYREGIS